MKYKIVYFHQKRYKKKKENEEKLYKSDVKWRLNG